MVGNRYKCEECDDYNLCEPCKNKDVHSHHKFRLVPALEAFPHASFPGFALSVDEKQKSSGNGSMQFEQRVQLLVGYQSRSISLGQLSTSESKEGANVTEGGECCLFEYFDDYNEQNKPNLQL